VLGVITQHDIIDHLFPDGEASAATEASLTASARVEIAMSEPAITVDSDSPALDALDTMLRTGTHMLPVISDGKLAGVLYRSGLCQAAAAGLLADD
jgi:CBS domain-containing protein